MRFLHRAPAARLVLALAFWAMSNPVAAEEGRLNKTVWSAQDASIAGYARTNATCEGIEPPIIFLDKPPEHGTVCWRSGKIRMNAVVEGNLNHCVGKVVAGVVVRYMSRRGYAGSDKVGYTVRFPRANHPVDVELTVRARASARSGMQSPYVDGMDSEQPEVAGPMPKCVLLMS
jgi:hypothetical protein